jgi:hypothetical protein
MKRTETYQEIKPLVDLCKSGKLFEVQEWIASGKPVNPPPSESGYRKKSPLEIAIELGFHSLIKVLLEGGADINEPRYHARHAYYAKEVGETRVRTLVWEQGAGGSNPLAPTI